jgi:hypothetical protein
LNSIILLIYFRYKDELILTWNGTNQELQAIIQQMQSVDPMLKMNIQIGRTIQFLDVHLENRQALLYSRLHHHEQQQRYTLPYTMHGQSKTIHSHWLRSSLIRTVRYCTSVVDFNRQRISLEVACLANGYSLKFIEKRLAHFFNYFNVNSLRTCLDQQMYNRLRHRLFNFVSEQRRYQEHIRLLEEKNDYIRLTYYYELGPKHQFNEEMKRILFSQFESTEATLKKKKLKLKMITKSPHTLNALLSEQQPKMS